MQRILPSALLILLASLAGPAQYVVAPQPVRLQPVGVTPITLQPGMRYTLEIPQANLIRPTLDAPSLPPNVKFERAPDLGDGVTRYYATVAPGSEPVETKVEVTETAQPQPVETPAIVKQPTPAEEPGPEGHPPHHDEENSNPSVSPEPETDNSVNAFLKRNSWLVLIGLFVAYHVVRSLSKKR